MEPAVDEHQELLNQTAYALTCFKQWGLTFGSAAGEQTRPASVVAALINLVQKSRQENESLRDKLARSQSDTRMLDSIRVRLEGALEDASGKLAALKLKQAATDDRWISEIKRLRDDKDALARQLKDSHQRQIVQQHTIKRQEGEYSQLQRHLRTSNSSVGAASPKGVMPQSRDEVRSPTRRRSSGVSGGRGGGGSCYKGEDVSLEEEFSSSVQLRCSSLLNRSNSGYDVNDQPQLAKPSPVTEGRSDRYISKWSGRKTWGINGRQSESPEASPGHNSLPTVLEILRQHADDDDDQTSIDQAFL